MTLLINTTVGISYGTTLGATVASMFPDRIDKMVLDGVQNPHEYYNGVA
jgi:pimeloyl-ACP methyl ester carboxylesterase